MAPRIHHFPGGWSVSDGSFATFAATREEALHRYERGALGSHASLASHCPDDASIMLDGVDLCMTRYNIPSPRMGATDSPDVRSVERRVEEPVRTPRRQTSAR